MPAEGKSVTVRAICQAIIIVISVTGVWNAVAVIVRHIFRITRIIRGQWNKRRAPPGDSRVKRRVIAGITPGIRISVRLVAVGAARAVIQWAAGIVGALPGRHGWVRAFREAFCGPDPIGISINRDSANNRLAGVGWSAVLAIKYIVIIIITVAGISAVSRTVAVDLGTVGNSRAVIRPV